MSGTRAGGLKVKAKNLARDPNHYEKIGAIGGSKGKGGGFTGNPEAARIAGKKGGAISSRAPFDREAYLARVKKWADEHGGEA